VDHVRLFPRHGELRWRYRVHEQILPALKELGIQPRWSDVVIHHVGYQDRSLRGRKLERDLRLLQLDQAEHPDHPFILFNMGSIYQEQGRAAEAIPLFKRSLELSHPADSIVRKLYALLAQCHNQLDEREEALAACRAGRVHYPDDVEILFQEGVARRQIGDAAGARTCWEQVLASRPGPHFASVNTGIRGHLTRHNLAAAYHDLGDTTAAEAEWRAALAEKPGFEPACLGLAEMLLAQQRWTDLEDAASTLEKADPGSMQPNLLRARAYLRQKEFHAARALLLETIDRFPHALELPRLLSHVYLQEGQDWQAAEKALRAVLAIDPAHGEALHNLMVLARERA
jgi:tetratricopeptide (TPR) repeat protein